MSYNLLNLASQVRCRAPGSTGQNSSVVGETVYYADGSTGVVSSPVQSIPHWELGERYQHFGARAYDPLTCTFMQTDPLAEKYYGVSPYAYCAGNPVMFVDPDGRAVDWRLVLKGSSLVAGGAISICGAALVTEATSGLAAAFTAVSVTNSVLTIGAGMGMITVGLAGLDEEKQVVESLPKGVFEMGGLVADKLCGNESGCYQSVGALADEVISISTPSEPEDIVSLESAKSLTSIECRSSAVQNSYQDLHQVSSGVGNSQNTGYVVTFDWQNFSAHTN